MRALTAVPLLSVITQVAAFCAVPHIQDFVVFGDSYTDDCNAWRLSEPENITGPYLGPNATCPSADVVPRSTGTWIWPEILKNATGWNVVNRAVSGATCNNTLFPRNNAKNWRNDTITLPDVGQQIEQFVETHGEGPTFTLDPAKSVAAIFIGTNDIGIIFGRYQSPLSRDVLPSGVTIVDLPYCILGHVSRLYGIGFRNVVIMEPIPLQYAPWYSRDTVPGYGFIIHQDGAFTARAAESFVAATRKIQELLLPPLAASLSGANFGIFPTHSLFYDMLTEPRSYFGGNASSRGFCNVCPGPLGGSGNCTVCADLDQYSWFDPLHPGIGPDRVLANRMTKYLGGQTDVVSPGQ